MMGTMYLPIFSLRSKEHADESHNGRDWPVAAAFEKLFEIIERRRFQWLGRFGARGHQAAQSLPPFTQILQLRRIFGRAVERRFFKIFVGNGHAETGTESAKLVLVQLLLLVRNIASLARFAQTVAFDGLGENYCWRPLVLHGGLVRGVDLLRIVSAAVELAKLLIAQVRHQLLELYRLAKEMIADVFARFDDILLVLHVHDLVHAFNKPAVLVRL